MKRRVFFHLVAGGVAGSVVGASPRKPEAESMRGMAEDFLREQGIRGMAVAFGRDGKIEFEEGFGFADAEGKEAVTPGHRFRIASIAKPFTATAVMMAVEGGHFGLGSPVFGPRGILGESYGQGLPESVLAITVDHLLTHTSGGWSNGKDDPMFLNPEMDHSELIAWTLANQKQTHPTGAHYGYSNFGYCVLGRVLEKATGLSYRDYVVKHLCSKCGITGMAIAGNTLADRLPREVVYHADEPGGAYGMNVARMDSHGGWIATAADLVRFASQLPKLLGRESILKMTTPGLDPGYARGWAVNSAPNWWHNGSLPGTSSIMVRSANGLCWSALLNGRTDKTGPALDGLMWRMGRSVKTWKL